MRSIVSREIIGGRRNREYKCSSLSEEIARKRSGGKQNGCGTEKKTERGQKREGTRKRGRKDGEEQGEEGERGISISRAIFIPFTILPARER